MTLAWHRVVEVDVCKDFGVFSGRGGVYYTACGGNVSSLCCHFGNAAKEKKESMREAEKVKSEVFEFPI